MRGITLNKSTQAVVYVITLSSCIHKQCSVCWFMPPRLEIKGCNHFGSFVFYISKSFSSCCYIKEEKYCNKGYGLVKGAYISLINLLGGGGRDYTLIYLDSLIIPLILKYDQPSFVPKLNME